MTSAVAKTELGPVLGVEYDGGVEFFGIPYAAPVSGSSRFSAPLPALPWSEVRVADSFAPIAPQPNSGLGSYVPGDPIIQGEDCLALNIWTPACDGGHRPVMIFIHGGAFLSGSGSSVMYRGERLSARGLVVATFNYRLGLFGFLWHPALLEEGLVPNRGLLDQVRAMEWLARNVESFGGDPENMTVVGESAGAMSIADLLSVAAVRPLLRRAVLESGATTVLSHEEAARRAERLFELAELGPPSLEALVEAPLPALLAAQDLLTTELGGAASMPFQPVIDGSLLSAHPDEAFAKGETSGLELILGTNRDEFRFFTFSEPRLADISDEQLGEFIRPYLYEVGAAIEPERIIEHYRGALEREGLRSDQRSIFERVGTDLVFRIPMLRLADAHVANGGRAYCYRFDWESPFAQGVLGACHALELPFVFGTIDNPVITFFTGSGDAAERLSDAMQESWAHFVQRGEPGTPSLMWPPYESTRRATRVFGAEVELVNAPGEAERILFEEVMPPLGGSVD